MSDKQKKKRKKKRSQRQGRGSVCSPLESTQFFYKQERCKPNKLIQGGFCVDRVGSANPAPQTFFKESHYLHTAFDVGIDHAPAVRNRDAADA